MKSGPQPHTSRLRPGRASLALVCSLWILVPEQAGAAPLQNNRYGGLNPGSPVEPHPASILRNPAAVGLLRGTHVFLDGTVRLEHGRVRRHAIRSDTGNPGPGADLSFDSESFAHWTPDLYFGLTTDLGSDLVVIGIALSTPFAEMQRFPTGLDLPRPDEESPVRYHRIRSDWFHLFVSPVVAVRIHERFYLGIGMSYVRSMFHMQFARDRRLRDGSVPPHEDPLYTERVELDGAEDSFCFNVGLVIRLPHRVDIGLSYRSKVVGVNQDDIRAEGKAKVTRREIDPDTQEASWVTYNGRARTEYELPDSLLLGVKWAWRAWEFGFGFEWERWSEHKDIKFTLTGNEFRGLADMANWDVNFVHYRGFQDVFRVSLSAGRRLSKKVFVLVGAMFESSAVPKKWVSAAAIDSHKLELLLGLVWRPHKAVGLHFGYGVSLAPEVRVSESGFDPGVVVRCVEDRVDILWSENCRRTTEGKGLPTAAGDYWQMTHRLGIGISYDYW